MLMTPPHYQNLRHGGRKIKDGESVEVDAPDVEALEAAGWKKAKPAKAAPKAKADKKGGQK